ncbi:MAG: glutathione peroxidase [Mucilaginibacter polytrichastri]|nr:glutathione peroxidase [Mucilaginibacter polytrichastri]
MTTKNIYQFSVVNIHGEEVSLADYAGKVLMIVNTASECGFTPQLGELEKLREERNGQDFEILAFPSNDFGGQEPLNAGEIEQFCRVKYGTRFPLFDKINVRGAFAHPMFRFLAERKLNGRVQAKPRWNFHKYIINRKGEVVDFFYPFTKPTSAKVRKVIDRLLSQQIRMNQAL